MKCNKKNIYKKASRYKSIGIFKRHVANFYYSQHTKQFFLYASHIQLCSRSLKKKMLKDK